MALPGALKYRLANFVMSYLIQTDRKTRLMDDIFHGMDQQLCNTRVNNHPDGGGRIRQENKHSERKLSSSDARLYRIINNCRVDLNLLTV
ncbi:hypothetical protein TcasGA2_TC007416 [Tribolium castaneum]|uniref:Uncharacterized protein n=1 Tax=Tribolium castaneum TaxID=7070 RepID=D1ZZQ1_TRICA|nr:hypothetical protein TcasGA2_TC007416 [Tribolium castaneum]